MQNQMGNVSSKIEAKRKNPKVILEIKSIVIKMKNAFFVSSEDLI